MATPVKSKSTQVYPESTVVPRDQPLSFDNYMLLARQAVSHWVRPTDSLLTFMDYEDILHEVVLAALRRNHCERYDWQGARGDKSAGPAFYVYTLVHNIVCDLKKRSDFKHRPLQEAVEYRTPARAARLDTQYHETQDSLVTGCMDEASLQVELDDVDLVAAAVNLLPFIECRKQQGTLRIPSETIIKKILDGVPITTIAIDLHVSPKTLRQALTPLKVLFS